MNIQLAERETVLFIGDSITDCGRAQPVGARAGLGEGYVAFVDALLAARHPEKTVRVLNTGVSGNRITDLEARWQRDVLDLQPDWLSVMIGINDVWRQFDDHANRVQVSLESFEAIYRRLLEAARPRLRGLVLMTPYFIEPNRADPMRTTMDAYGEVVRLLAADMGAEFVDTQAAFDRYLVCRPVQSLCGDRIHPNKTGHMILAAAFLEAMGFEWPGGAFRRRQQVAGPAESPAS